MPPTAYSRARTRLYRLLHDRRPAEERWSERQQPIWDELVALVGDREHLQPFKIDICDGEGEWAELREQQLLLAIGTICLANDRPDIWRQIYEVLEEVPAPGGELTLLEELADKARRGDI